MEAKEELDSIKRDVTQILFLLESNDKIGQEGLVNKVNRIDSLLQELLIRERVYKAKAATWGAAAGAIITGLIFGLKALALKLIAFLN